MEQQSDVIEEVGGGPDILVRESLVSLIVWCEQDTCLFLSEHQVMTKNPPI